MGGFKTSGSSGWAAQTPRGSRPRYWDRYVTRWKLPVRRYRGAVEGGLLARYMRVITLSEWMMEMLK